MNVCPFAVRLCATRLVCPAMTRSKPLTCTRVLLVTPDCRRVPRSGVSVTATPLRRVKACTSPCDP
jgi:hypothetical protein